MRNFIIAALVALFVVPSMANVSFAVTVAKYNSTTGGITFEDVNTLIGLRLNSSLGELIVGQATDLGGAAGCAIFCVVNDQAPDLIEWGNLLGMTFVSEFAGNVFPSGLSQSNLDNQFEFLYTGALITEGKILLVPEPSTLILAGLSLVSVFASRRRKS